MRDIIAFRGTQIFESEARNLESIEEELREKFRLVDNIRKERSDAREIHRENANLIFSVKGSLIYGLGLSNCSLHYVPEQLSRLTSLRELTLNNNFIERIEHLENLKNLEYLNISNNYLTEIEGIGELTNLKEISLSSNYIKEIKGLDKLKSLETLGLNFNYLKEISGLEELISLKRLYLLNNFLSEFKGVSSLVNLEVLDVDNNRISRWRGLENCKALKYIWKLDNVGLESAYYENFFDIDVEEEIMIPVLYCQFLVDKDLVDSGANVNAEKKNILAFKKYYGDLAEQKGLPFIHQSVDQMYVKLQGKKIFVKKKPWTDTFKILDLSGKNIKYISDIEGLELLAKLTTLDLSNNKITEISGLENLIELRELYLSNNPIMELKGLETLTQLEKLGIDETDIPIEVILDCGGVFDGLAYSPQLFVKYCQKIKQEEEG